jgi:hypothetical protein
VLAVAGIALSVLALCWAPLLPINKKLWTGSYVLLSTGTALLALSALAWIIELRGARSWTYFFEVFGKNTLLIYMLSQVAVIALDKTGTYSPLAAALAPVGSPEAASLALRCCSCLPAGWWVTGWTSGRSTSRCSVLEFDPVDLVLPFIVRAECTHVIWMCVALLRPFKATGQRRILRRAFGGAVYITADAAFSISATPDYGKDTRSRVEIHTEEAIGVHILQVQAVITPLCEVIVIAAAFGFVLPFT